MENNGPLVFGGVLRAGQSDASFNGHSIGDRIDLADMIEFPKRQDNLPPPNESGDLFSPTSLVLPPWGTTPVPLSLQRARTRDNCLRHYLKVLNRTARARPKKRDRAGGLLRVS